MPRPRREFSGNDTVDFGNDPLYTHYLPGEVGSRRGRRWDISKNWSHRSLNSPQDPLSLMLVVDALLKIDTSIELRAKQFAEFLNEQYKQIQWDHINLGKILSALCDDMTQAIGNTAFLRRNRDERGVFYLLSITPDSVKLLHGLRDDLQRLTQIRLAEPIGYRTAKSPESPLFECPSLRGEFVAVDE